MSGDRRRGRRPLAENEATKPVLVRVPEGDLATIDRAAELAGVSRAEYVHRTTVARAKRDLRRAEGR